MTNPVESFSFHLVPGGPSSPVSESGGDRFWEQPDLFGQLEDGQANEFQYVHRLSRSHSLLAAQDLHLGAAARYS